MKNKTIPELCTSLFALQDTEYKAFHEKLIPSVASEKVIGIRTPVLRQFARELAKTEDASVFMEILPHTYYEENNSLIKIMLTPNLLRESKSKMEVFFIL